MAIIEIRRVCKECEKSQALLRETRAEIQQFRLDYQALYEKVRSNLAKLAKRADADAESGPTIVQDEMAKARSLLLQRKLNRG